MIEAQSIAGLIVSLGTVAAMIGVYQLVAPPCPRCGARSWDKYTDLRMWWRCNKCGEWVDWR